MVKDLPLPALEFYTLKASNWEIQLGRREAKGGGGGGRGNREKETQSTREGSDWSISGYVSSPGPIIVASTWSTMIGSTWSHGPVLWVVIDSFLQNHWPELGRSSPQKWERDVLDHRRVCHSLHQLHHTSFRGMTKTDSIVPVPEDLWQ